MARQTSRMGHDAGGIGQRPMAKTQEIEQISTLCRPDSDCFSWGEACQPMSPDGGVNQGSGHTRGRLPGRLLCYRQLILPSLSFCHSFTLRIHSFCHSLTLALIRFVARLPFLIPSIARSPLRIHLFCHSLTLALIRFVTRLPSHSFVLSLAYPCIHSFCHLFTLAFIRFVTRLPLSLSPFLTFRV